LGAHAQSQGRRKPYRTIRYIVVPGGCLFHPYCREDDAEGRERAEKWQLPDYRLTIV